MNKFILAISALVLSRPLIDIFWSLKEISPYYSPLNISGVLLFITSVTGIIYYRGRIKLQTADVLFLIFGVLVFVNSILLMLSDPGTDTLGLAIKLNVPAALYFFFRVVPGYEMNFDLIMKVFLAACTFPLLMLAFEIFILPINPFVPGGRYVERIRGLYADSVSYIIYFAIAVISAGYFFLRRSSSEKQRWQEQLSNALKDKWFLILCTIVFLVITGLIYIAHAAGYFLFLVLLCVVFFGVFRKAKVYGFIIIFAAFTAIMIFYPSGIEDRLVGIFQLDVKVLAGEEDIEHAFNGRAGIWMRMMEDYGRQPIAAKVFGTGFGGSGMKNVTSSPHNDFIRILFAAGLTGLLAWVFLIINFVRVYMKAERRHLFSGISAIVVVVMMSFTLTPSFYIPLMMFVCFVFAGGREDKRGMHG